VPAGGGGDLEGVLEAAQLLDAVDAEHVGAVGRAGVEHVLDGVHLWRRRAECDGAAERDGAGV
jgi:hypothetical protein